VLLKSALHPQAWTYIYRSMPVGTYRVQSPGFPMIVYCECHHPMKPTWKCLTYQSPHIYKLYIDERIPWGERAEGVIVYKNLYYPTTWAATRYLRRIHLHFFIYFFFRGWLNSKKDKEKARSFFFGQQQKGTKTRFMRQAQTQNIIIHYDNILKQGPTAKYRCCCCCSVPQTNALGVTSYIYIHTHTHNCTLTNIFYGVREECLCDCFYYRAT